MMRKHGASPLAQAPAHDDVSELTRLVRSLQRPLSPEGKRVLAAARVGLELLQQRAEARKAGKVTALHTRRRKLTAGVHPLREENLPGCIREMLDEYRHESR